MADLYTVMFKIGNEPSSARFEIEVHAKHFADRLAFGGIKAEIHDEFNREGPLYTAEPESLPNGVYLIADTPPTATPLAVEDGSGDRNLLREALSEQGITIDD